MNELDKIRRVAGARGRGRAARGAAGARRDGRPERRAAGARVHQRGRRHRHRPDQARWHRQGRRRGGDRARPEAADPLRRRRRGHRRPDSVLGRRNTSTRCSRRSGRRRPLDAAGAGSTPARPRPHHAQPGRRRLRRHRRRRRRRRRRARACRRGARRGARARPSRRAAARAPRSTARSSRARTRAAPARAPSASSPPASAASLRRWRIRFRWCSGRGFADAARARHRRSTSASSAQAALRLNQPFLTSLRERRPFVILKAATSLDGRIAAAPGVRTPLTSAPALRHAQYVRAQVDAVACRLGDRARRRSAADRARGLPRAAADAGGVRPPAADAVRRHGCSRRSVSRTGDNTDDRLPAAGRSESRAAALERAGATVIAAPEPGIAHGAPRSWRRSTCRACCSKAAPRCTPPRGTRAWSTTSNCTSAPMLARAGRRAVARPAGRFPRRPSSSASSSRSGRMY